MGMTMEINGPFWGTIISQLSAFYHLHLPYPKTYAENFILAEENL